MLNLEELTNSWRSGAPQLHSTTAVRPPLLLCIATSKGGPDEFQLVAFVMKFKGQQFITGGLIAAARGGFE